MRTKSRWDLCTEQELWKSGRLPGQHEQINHHCAKHHKSLKQHVHWSLIQKFICRSVGRTSYHCPGDGYSRHGQTYINYKKVHGCRVAGLRSCVKVEVAVLGTPSLADLMVSVDLKEH